MAIQTKAEAEAELAVWYQARTAAAAGKSITIQTAAGSRTLTRQDLGDINSMIAQLERKIAAPAGNGSHNFAVASWNHDLDGG